MKQVKVYIEKAEFGFSAYMEDAGLDYGCTGDGATVQEAIDDFRKSYEGIKEFYGSIGRVFEEIDFQFYYDTASFLAEYCEAFSLAGLQRITGINQKQLGHYLHGQSKPSKKTVAKIAAGVRAFAASLTALQFV